MQGLHVTFFARPNQLMSSGLLAVIAHLDNNVGVVILSVGHKVCRQNRKLASGLPVALSPCTVQGRITNFSDLSL